MCNQSDMCWYDRLRRYEEEKEKLLHDHPEYTSEEYEKAIRKLTDKWRI